MSSICNPKDEFTHYIIIRKTYDNDGMLVNTATIGNGFKTYEDADIAVCNDVSEFRDYHDNDERIDWNIVEVYDDIGKCLRYEWEIRKEGDSNPMFS